MTRNYIILIVGVALSTLTQASPPAAPLASAPPWQELTLERKSMWGSVHAKLQLEKSISPDGDEHWLMNIATSVGSNNSEKVTLEMRSLAADIIHKQRYSQGRKDQRFKSFDYGANAIGRLRKDPAEGEDTLGPEHWSLSDQQNIAYPKLAPETALTTPYALFLLVADDRLATTGAQLSVYVHTDYNIYKVVLRNSGQQEMIASYTFHSGDQTTRFKKEATTTDLITLDVTPVSEPARPDFEVMGLTGEVAFLVDRSDRIPVRISGTAPRVGETHIDLTGARY
jgi:hypothetical protein